jgi:hypothetical protein
MAAVGTWLTTLALIALCSLPSVQNEVIFCATRSTNLTGAANVVGFDGLTSNVGNGFDLSTDTFTAPESGYYWISFSAAIQAEDEADVRLVGSTRQPNIFRESTSLNGVDTTSRNELTVLTAGSSKLTLSSDFPLYSDAGLQVSFSGFSLDSIMTTVVGFSFGLSNTDTTAGRLIYDQIYVDTHSGWNTSTNSYIAPVDGTYFITLNAANDGVSPGFTDLYAAGSLLTRLYHYSNATGPDSSSKSVIIQLTAGQQIYTTLTDPNSYSDLRYQTSLLGFLYNPYRQLPISWSVATEASATGLVYPLGFDVVFVNQGNGWNVATNLYKVPLSGTYYITWTAGSYAPYPSLMELVLNESPVANIYRGANLYSNIDTKSRSIILQLVLDDELKIRVPAGYRIYSNAQRITTFSGIRIGVTV